MPEGAHLHIAIIVTDQCCETKFSAPDGSILVVEGSLDSNGLKDNRRLLDQDLKDFKRLVGRDLTISIPSQDLNEAMRSLHEGGWLMMRRLIPAQRLKEVQDFCWKACFGPLNAVPGPGSALPVVHVETRLKNAIPVELWPLWKRGGSPSVSNASGLWEFANTMLGFSTRVIRTLPKRIWTEPEMKLLGDPLPVAHFQFAGLQHVALEQSIFDDNPKIQYSGIWPQDTAEGEEEHLISDFCRRFWDDTFQVQVQHFSCHFQSAKPLQLESDGYATQITPEILSENSYILLSWDKKDRVKVKMRDIRLKFGDLLEQNPWPDKAARPLVFVNACGSSHIDPQGVTSFPQVVLEDAGCRGFVGTETSVPDEAAAHFAKHFYQGLTQNRNLGEALSEARRTLLRNHNNPLGILYTAYGDSAMRVIARAPKEV